MGPIWEYESKVAVPVSEMGRGGDLQDVSSTPINPPG